MMNICDRHMRSQTGQGTDSAAIAGTKRKEPRSLAGTIGALTLWDVTPDGVRRADM